MKLGLLFVLGMAMLNSAAWADCPKSDLGETAEDCPWAHLSRYLQSKPKFVIESEVRELSKYWKQDAAHKEVLDFWGRSLNYDEFAKAEIVAPPILDALAKLLGAPARKDRVVHAGMEHTYGYLFSTLKTPFGYKRARWVRPDIEQGFGLSRGVLGPRPSHGTLLSNVTYFAGKIAFASGSPEAKKLGALKSRVAPELAKFNYEQLKPKHLVEQTGEIKIHTFLVPFTHPPKNDQGNSHLLIYSIEDAGGTHLITAFPVETKFVITVLDPAKLGENQPIQTRYNAFVSSITGSSTPVTGSRTLKE